LERSKDIYEIIKGYQIPPMIPLPDLKNNDLLAELELATHRTKYELRSTV